MCRCLMRIIFSFDLHVDHTHLFVALHPWAWNTHASLAHEVEPGNAGQPPCGRHLQLRARVHVLVPVVVRNKQLYFRSAIRPCMYGSHSQSQCGSRGAPLTFLRPILQSEAAAVRHERNGRKGLSLRYCRFHFFFRPHLGQYQSNEKLHDHSMPHATDSIWPSVPPAWKPSTASGAPPRICAELSPH